MRIFLFLAATLVLALTTHTIFADPVLELKSIDRKFSVSKVNTEARHLARKLKSAPLDDKLFLQDLKDRYNELSPAFLYHISERTFSQNKAEAIEWYWLGHIRSRMDAVLCADSTAAQGVVYLSGHARSVAAYIRANPKESGEIGYKVLERNDLRASEASPWWICSHGIRAVNSALQRNLQKSADPEVRKKLGDMLPPEEDLSWILPEEEMPARYTKVIEGARGMFDKLTAPMDDPTEKLAFTEKPIQVTSSLSVGQLRWGNGSTLFFTESIPRSPNKLHAWNGQTIRIIADDISIGPCISGDYVSYRHSMPKKNGPKPKFDRNAPKTLLYKAGNIYTNLETNSFEFERSVSPGYFASLFMPSGGFSEWGQSPITCEWSKIDKRAPTKSAYFYKHLGEGRGYLMTSKKGGTIHYSDEHTNPVKVSDLWYDLECMRELKHKNAIQLVACPISYTSRRGNPAHKAHFNVSLLHFNKGVASLSTEPLFRIPGETGQTQTLVTKRGSLRLMNARSTPVGNQPGGIYWNSGKKVLKVVEGFMGNADVDATGCKVAYTISRAIGEKPSLEILNVCEALPA